MNDLTSSKVTEKITFERTFTTAPKHRQGAIRKRCLAFINYLVKVKGVERIPLNEAKTAFQFYVNYWDQKTLKAYFGTQWTTSERTIDVTTVYRNTGSVSPKTIRLRQKIPIREGYLEKLGLIEYEFNPQSRAYFLVVKNPGSIVPEVGLSSTSINEGSQGSITNLSLSLRHVGEQSRQPLAVNIETTEKRESIVEGEIKSLEFGTPTLELSPLEKAILHAKPCVREPDRTHIEWQESDSP